MILTRLRLKICFLNHQGTRLNVSVINFDWSFSDLGINEAPNLGIEKSYDLYNGKLTPTFYFDLFRII